MNLEVLKFYLRTDYLRRMERFTIPQLKSFLREKDASCSGNKPDLLARLAEILYKEGIDPQTFADEKYQKLYEVHPDDSISQVQSNPTGTKPKTNVSRLSLASIHSIKSERIKETARKAALEARRKTLQNKMQSEMEKVRLQFKDEEVKLQAEIAEVEAKEKVYLENEELENSSHVSARANTVNNIPTSQKPKNELIDTLVTFTMKNSMPKTQIKTFDGDYTEFPTFLKSFDNIISAKLSDHEERLYYLSQFTSGKPNEIIKACMHMPIGQGYTEARTRLEKRYGNPDLIVSKYISKILSFPIIKIDNVEKLDEFSLLLINCKNTISKISSSVELQHPKTMREILKKLPFSVQEKWRRKVDDILEKQNGNVTFANLVDFIETESRIANNPLYGRAFFGSDRKDFNNNKVSCNTTNMQKIKCWFCEESHFLEKCPKLQSETYENRIKFIKDKKLCFMCMARNHMSKNCPRKRTCEICGLGHNTLTHRSEGKTENPSKDKSVNEAPIAENFNVQNNTIGNSMNTGRMHVIPVKVRVKEGHFVNTYAYFDDGSNGSFCTKSLCDKLGIVCNEDNRIELSVSTINRPREVMDSYLVKNLIITGIDEQENIELPPLFVMDQIPASKNNIIKQEELRKWPHLASIEVPKINADIGLLIGNDNPIAIEPFKIINSPKGTNGPYAVLTRLGWFISGLKTNNYYNRNVNSIHIEDVETKRILLGMYKRDFSDLNSTEVGHSEEDRQWIKKVESSCKLLPSGHYEIALPFKKDVQRLPDSKAVAFKRLFYLKSKMKKNVNFHVEYKNFIEEMLQMGYAEKSLHTNNEWFIPHFGVYHPQKQKVRVVYDCAARVNDVSLNDLLLQGPDLTSDLLAVLIRFRQGKYAFTADIKKMFYQVMVPESD